ncbi:MAG: ribosome silencing factor [Spirochaetaceae bacterium]|nr:ribosome silencing factor [Spirochaetaceae bacterium]
MDDTLKINVTDKTVLAIDPAVKTPAGTAGASAGGAGYKTDEAIAIELGKLLKEHKGGDVALIDLRPLSIWTDFFIVTTVTSGAHLSGLQRHVNEFAHENKLPVLHGHKKLTLGNGWDICDLGFMVVHLMTEASRSFYELENLWSGGLLLKL